ncbi:hypothetical protein K502DRAFT_362576 [Neoconidiobolus thromboides FSU 785]|nr:hypothetical protein K502DRAFT_362576 [Neoconidiobolus thromboides FSU 785]
MDEEITSEYLYMVHNPEIGYTISPYYSGTNTPIEGGDIPFRSIIDTGMFNNASLPRQTLFPDNMLNEANFFFRSTPNSPRSRNNPFFNGPAPTPNNGFNHNFMQPRMNTEIYSAPVSPRSRQQQQQQLQDEASLYLNDLYAEDVASNLPMNNPNDTQPMLANNGQMEPFNSMAFTNINPQENNNMLELSYKNPMIPTIAFNMNETGSTNNQMFSMSDPNLVSSSSYLNLDPQPTKQGSGNVMNINQTFNNSMVAITKPLESSNNSINNKIADNNNTNCINNNIKKESVNKAPKRSNSFKEIRPKTNTKESNDLEMNTKINVNNLAVDYLKPIEIPRINELKQKNGISSPNTPKESMNIPVNIYTFFKDPTPPRNENIPLNYEILIMGIPPTGIRSRVETQVKLCLKLINKTGTNSIPWTHLRLPPHLIVGQKDRRKAPKTSISPREDKIVNLRATVTCASNPKQKVQVCIGCVQRERKRQSKRHSKSCNTPSTTPIPSLPGSPSLYEETLEGDSVDQEQKKIITFNTTNIIDLSTGDVILPSRITCYCRHHKETTGFIVKFSLYDDELKLLAVGETPPIMITDDHKTKQKALEASNNKKLRGPKSTKAESSSFLAPIPEAIPHIPINSMPNFYSIAPNMMNKPTMPLSSAFQPNLAHSLNIAVQQPFSQVTLRPPPLLKTIKPSSMPKIARIVPSQSPLHGGVEVAILGTNFKEGMIVYFGDIPSAICNVWSDQSALCLVPPRTMAGIVNVTIRPPNYKATNQATEEPYLDQLSKFTYKDGTEQDLLELALQVVGLRKNGRVEPANQVALRIIQDQNQLVEYAGLSQSTTVTVTGLEAPAPPTTPTKD